MDIKPEYGLELSKELSDAAYHGQFELVQNLVSKMFTQEAGKFVNINQKDQWGYTALMYAAREGHVNICLALIEKGSSLNMQNLGGDTSLIWATIRGHKEVMKVLLEKGADVTIHNNVRIFSILVYCPYVLC
jgi:ankyrin repeat protein